MKAAEVLGIVSSLITITAFVLSFFLNIHHFRDLRLFSRIRSLTIGTKSISDNEGQESPITLNAKYKLFYHGDILNSRGKLLFLLILICIFGGANGGLLGKPAIKVIQSYAESAVNVARSVSDKVLEINIEADPTVEKTMVFGAKLGAVAGAILGPFLVIFISFYLALEFTLGFITGILANIGEHNLLFNEGVAEVFATSFIGGLGIGISVSSLMLQLHLTIDYPVMLALSALAPGVIFTSVSLYYNKRTLDKEEQNPGIN